MKAGAFTLFETIGKKSAARMFREAEEECQFLEEAGFEAVHPAEHHFSKEYGNLPRTELFLAKIAGKTSRLKLIPMVVLAPFTHPLRLAEDGALLDLLSDGRFTLSVGSGYRGKEFLGFGQEISQNSERTRETLEIVKKAWTEESFHHDGKFYKIPEISVYPKPVQKPHPPILLVTATPAHIQWAAERGFGILPTAGFTVELFKKDREHFVNSCRAAGQDPFKHESIAFKWIYVDDTDEKAREIGEKAFMDTFMAFFADGEKLVHTLLSRLQLGPDSPKQVSFDILTSEQHLMAFVYGSPDTVIKKLTPYRETGMTYFIGGFNIGALPTEMVRRSMERFVKYVLPNL